MGKLAYSSSLLSPAENKFLVEQTGRLLSLQRQTAQNVIEMGSILIEVKQVIPKGQFEDYLIQTFGNDSGYTPRSAQNFMNVARHFAGRPITDAIAPSVLYLLSAPSTPEVVRELACELAENGEKISVDRAKEMISEARDASAMTVDVVAEVIPTPSFRHPSQEGIPLKDVDWDAVPDSEFGFFSEFVTEFEEESVFVQPPASDSSLAEIPVEPRFLLTGDLLGSLKKVRERFDMDLCRAATYPNVPCDKSFSEVEGLKVDWGGSVFLALPEHKPGRWVSKLQMSDDVRVAVVLASAQTDRLWFQQLMLISSAFCCLTASSQVVFYVGTSSKHFIECFSDRGVICRRAV